MLAGDSVIGAGVATVMLVVLVMLIAFGVQVATALGLVSMAAIYAATGDWQVVSRLIVATAYDGLRVDAIIAIPLFMLMGEFIARSGAVTDVFRAATCALHRVPSGAALAAVAGNALHAFVAGGSAAGTAGYSHITYGELRRRAADRAASLGMLAGASALGMLLPPSVLMVTWGILTRQPVGAIFLAMLIPAMLALAGFVVSVLVAAPAPGSRENSRKDLPTDAPPPRAVASLIGILLVVVTVLLCVGLRLLSVAETASLGVGLALIMAIGKGMRAGAIVEAILVVGRASAPILLLIFAALLYGQALAVTGAGAAIQAALGSLGAAGALAVMVAIWLVLVTVLDALSAVALTAALFVPAASTLGIDPLALAVIGVLVLEGAPLVPPFGLLVFTARAAGEDGVPVFDIFRHVLPVLTILMAAILLVAAFPKVAIWLPYLVR
ncbi:TRAP transporter large permease [Undibacter mobilis]|uniref:TRAP transporter large permease n=1 Tax=Undibacter mobilis TaxID=2292256 RepID=A0A371B9W3_9BRAD|nr:TRAP transporter large permease [Undibacter mobilis]